MRANPEVTLAARSPTLQREFVVEQLPLIAAVLVLAFVIADVQGGFRPGGEIAFPLAELRIPIWHLIWMGFWTGYTMALVGEAAGIFALPYTMSILQFANLHVTPTMQLITFLNPFGALFGFRRSRQWNLDLALWVCLGGGVGGLSGPFLRITVLSEVRPFTLAVGLTLVFAGGHLCIAAVDGFRRRTSGSGLEAKFHTEAEARRLAKSRDLWITRLYTGRPGAFPSVEEAEAYPYTEQELAIVHHARRRTIAGAPEQVRDRLMALASAYGAAELVIVTITFDFKARLRSYQLLAEAFGLHPA